jgi:hypothetical protein
VDRGVEADEAAPVQVQQQGGRGGGVREQEEGEG